VVGVGDGAPTPVANKAAFEAAVAQQPWGTRVAVAVRRRVELPEEAAAPDQAPADEVLLEAALRAKGKREDAVELGLQALRFQKREAFRAAEEREKSRVRQTNVHAITPPCRVRLSGLSGPLAMLNGVACVAERIEAGAVVAYAGGKIVKVPLGCCASLPWEEAGWHAHSGSADEFTYTGPLFFVPDEFAIWRGERRRAFDSAWFALKTDGPGAAKQVWDELMVKSKGVIVAARGAAKKAREQAQDEAKKAREELKAEAQTVKEAAKREVVALKEAAKKEADAAKEEAKKVQAEAKQKAVAVKAELQMKVRFVKPQK
jgi:hypothetical protein